MGKDARQNSSLSALGGNGSDEGYTGILNSLAVEFDTSELGLLRPQQ